MNIRDYDPTKGMAFQGDVSIIPVPPRIARKLDRSDEIAPSDGRLILQAGEVTGHHHAIYLITNIPHFHDTALSASLEATAAKGVARLYRDRAIVEAMVSAGTLTRSDLAVGVLDVTDGPIVVSHEEHDGIRLIPGCYLIGRQVESVGAEERRVAD